MKPSKVFAMNWALIHRFNVGANHHSPANKTIKINMINSIIRADEKYLGMNEKCIGTGKKCIGTGEKCLGTGEKCFAPTPHNPHLVNRRGETFFVHKQSSFTRNQTKMQFTDATIGNFCNQLIIKKNLLVWR